MNPLPVKRRGQLTVLLPGLSGPDAVGGDPQTQRHEQSLQAARALTEAVPLAGLSSLFAYANDDSNGFTAPTADGLLAEAFNVPLDESGQWCAAALARQGALGDARGRTWMRADPVHLHADMGRLIVFPPPMLKLDLAESSAICDWLNQHEYFPGPALDAVSGTCWLTELSADTADMCAVPPSVAHGEDADQLLPRGRNAAAWHARMNEIQMLLNQCPINHQRHSRGAMPVNSVWFWGAGSLPVPCDGESSLRLRVPYTQVHGDHDLLAGLADCAGLRVQPFAHDSARSLSPRLTSQLPPEPISSATTQSPHQLLVLDDLQLAACAADIGAWQAALHELDQRWLQPLADALHKGVWQRITIHVGCGAAVSIERPGLSRWLRRRRTISDVLARLRDVRMTTKNSNEKS